MTGFFEESQGVRSMTRLLMFGLLILAGVVVVVIAFYVLYCLRHTPPLPIDQYVILALVAALGALVLNGAVAIAKRNGGDGT